MGLQRYDEEFNIIGKLIQGSPNHFLECKMSLFDGLKLIQAQNFSEIRAFISVVQLDKIFAVHSKAMPIEVAFMPRIFDFEP